MKELQFVVRKSPSETELVDAVSDLYKDHFLFINWKGDLAIGHTKTGLMICDRNIIITTYGRTSHDNWRLQVDFAIQLSISNIQNTTTYFDTNNSCHVFGVNYAPEGKLSSVLSRFAL